MELDKLNRENFFNKIKSIEKKLDTKKEKLEEYLRWERDVREEVNSDCMQNKKPQKESVDYLSTCRNLRLTTELDIFLMSKQVEIIKNMLINNKVTEF